MNPDDLPFEAQFLEPMRYSYPDQQNLFQYWTNLHIDLFGGYFGSPNGNFTSQRYNLDRGHCGGMHENFMLHIVNNTGRIIKQCDASGKADVAAMMRVVQTYNLLNYTDAYGPVPFTSVFATAGDAFQPSSFAYDSQQEVYARMLEDLDSAPRGLCCRTDEPHGDERHLVRRRPGALDPCDEPAEAAHRPADGEGRSGNCETGRFGGHFRGCARIGGRVDFERP